MRFQIRKSYLYIFLNFDNKVWQAVINTSHGASRHDNIWQKSQFVLFNDTTIAYQFNNLGFLYIKCLVIMWCSLGGEFFKYFSLPARNRFYMYFCQTGQYLPQPLKYQGARFNSVVRACAHVMGHRIDPSWWTHWAISCSSQCSMTCVTRAVLYVLSCMWDDAYKRTLAANKKE